MKPSPCAKCGASAVKVHAHHADYSKPLDVEWLCVPCHRLTHTGGTRKPPRPPKPPHPSKYQISKCPRGWVRRVDGKLKWICSDKVAPTAAAADAYYAAHFLGKGA